MHSFVVPLLLLLTPEAPFSPDYLTDTTEQAFAAVDEQYRDCISLIAEDVEMGREGARNWAAEGGGAPAIHCQAVADLAAGYPRLAAVRLTKLSERADAGDTAARARILAQAALAWLESAEPAFAIEAADKAVSLAPNVGELRFVAAKAHAAAGSWEAAAAAATAAEESGIATAETYLIRAQARRALGKNTPAAEDVIAALKIDPFNLDALVLRGELIQAGVYIRANYQPVNQE